MSVQKPSNMVVAIISTIFFMIMQVVLFKYITFKKVNDIIADKINIFNTYTCHNKTLENKIKKYINSPHREQIKTTALQQKYNRDTHNNALLTTWITLPICFGMLILVYLIYKLYPTWTRTDSVLLTFAIITYTLCILWYYYIINNHEYYGDHMLYNKIYSALGDNIINNSLSETGETLRNDIKKVMSSNMTSVELIKNNPDLATSLLDIVGIVKHTIIPKYINRTKS